MRIAIRPGVPNDAPAMARLINEIIQVGGTTAHKSIFKPERILSDFIGPQAAIIPSVDDRDL